MNVAFATRWTTLLAVLSAVAGISLSLYLRTRIAQTETATARLAAESLRLNTEQELNLFAEVLESVCALHALSTEVNQAAMDEFIEKGLVYQHAILGPFGLTQRIGPQIRAAMEQQADAVPGTGYRVVERAEDGSLIASGSRAVYYPLTWQSRPGGLNLPVGFDFFSLNEETRKAIRRLEQSRRPVLVASPVGDQRSEIKSQRSESNHPPTSDLRPLPSGGSSYWVFAPVVPRQFKNLPVHISGTVIGFAVAVLNPDDILRRVTARSMSAPNLQLKLTVSPETPDAESIRLENSQWLYRSPLEAIGTRWTFECALPVALTGHRSTAALVSGLIITALLTALFLLIGSRTQKIEAEVQTRTGELRIANARLEENLHERARLEEEMNELAAQERRRIGRDLHDSLGQKLTGAVFLSRSLLNYFSNKGISNIEQGISNVEGQKSDDRGQRTEDGLSNQQPSNQQPATQLAHARTLNETLKEAVAQVRSMARGLAPVTLNDESLGEALEQLAEEMTGLYGVSCEVAEQSEPPALSQKTKEQLYLIAREAVNNAARHAQAGRITIRLEHLTKKTLRSHRLTEPTLHCSVGSMSQSEKCNMTSSIDHDKSGWGLCVEDDGKGLPEPPSSVPGYPSSAVSEGMGIRIMRHRAGLIGAEFTLTSTPGKGTMVEIKSDK